MMRFNSIKGRISAAQMRRNIMCFALTETCGNPYRRCGNPWKPCGNPVESLGFCDKDLLAHAIKIWTQIMCLAPMQTCENPSTRCGNQWKPLAWRTGPAGTSHLNEEKIMVFGTQGSLRNPFQTMRKPMETLWKLSGNHWVGDMGPLASATHRPCGNLWKSCKPTWKSLGCRQWPAGVEDRCLSNWNCWNC